MFQKTIKKEYCFSGTGLHSGKEVMIRLKPAPPNKGIIFRLKQKTIPLSLKNIHDLTRSIALGKKDNRIMTVEHLIASLYMLGITNIYIDADGQEIPALDGSAKQFVKIIKKAGIKKQKKLVKPYILKEPINLFHKDKFIIALPSDNLKITYTVDYDHYLLRHQSIHFKHINSRVFIKKIAPARTFGFMSEVNDLLKKGLAKGGSLKNAVVLDKNGYLNKRLRFKDECLRHKVLDFIGALAFLNRPIQAHFLVYRSGHKLDITFMQQLVKQIQTIE